METARGKSVSLRRFLGMDLSPGVVAGFAIAIGVVSWVWLPNGGLDMREDILPALTNWRAPWQEGMPLMPWAVVVLMPLRPVSARLATALVNGASVMLTGLVIRRLGGNILTTIPVFLSPIGYWMLTTGQTDALILACVLLPSGLDLLLLWKPQVVLQAFWVRVLKRPWRYLASGVVLVAISFLVWGMWPRAVLEFARGHLVEGWWNRSLWPYSIPIGLVLVYISIKAGDERYGIMASPLLSPYVNGPSYVGLAAAIAARWPKVLLVAWALWLLGALVAAFVPGSHLPWLAW